MILSRRPFLAAAAAAITALTLLGCASEHARPMAARAVLAPSGALRVGLYRCSPSSILIGPTPGAERGVGYDLGKALAARLDVPFEPVAFAKNADVLAGIEAGTLDVTFTNESPARAKVMAFAPTFMAVEKSFLVGPGSPLESLDVMHRPGLRIGVSEGSSTQGELAPDYPGAVLVPTPTLKAAAEMLRSGRLDAFATNKAILFEMADSLPGSRVLAGHWGMEHFGAAIPKSHAQQLGAVSAFVDAAIADSTVARAISRAGLRGTVAP
ncbi:MAG: transporter substrate-binding domain-containing protein [Caldimonas sp.]